jgi:hypothetical protein
MPLTNIQGIIELKFEVKLLEKYKVRMKTYKKKNQNKKNNILVSKKDL